MMTTLKAHFDGSTFVLDEAPPCPLAVGQEVRVVIDSLPSDTPPSEIEPPRKSRFGFAKGMIEMRDDFNDPLDEFAEYR